MIPTLQVGDHIFVNKFIYGVRIPWTKIKFGMNYRKPQRGEVIVFIYPASRKDEEQKDFIKRIVAVEGDTVELRDNHVIVNGKVVERVALPGDGYGGQECSYDDYSEEIARWEHRTCEAWQESVPGHQYVTYYERGSIGRAWPPHVVEPGTVWVMGDNRDNSHDSRYWGAVPFENIKGKAMIIWFSIGQQLPSDLPLIGPVASWLRAVRYDRFFHFVN
jgi:signal peptidase I